MKLQFVFKVDLWPERNWINASCWNQRLRLQKINNRDTQNIWANLWYLKDQQEGKLEREAILKD